jgi:glucose/arabinose dehydrogenase
MQKFSFRAGMAAAAVVFMMTGAAFAQTPDATPAPAPAPAAAPTPEPAAPAPAASAPAASTPAPAATAPTAATTEPTKEPTKAAADAPAKKSPHKKVSRNAEIDRSLRNGTVPARYRNSVPREYQQYIPFDRR